MEKGMIEPKLEITRRSFLKMTTGAALGTVTFPYIVSSSALGANGNVAASNRITVGCIGVGHPAHHGTSGDSITRGGQKQGPTFWPALIVGSGCVGSTIAGSIVVPTSTLA